MIQQIIIPTPYAVGDVNAFLVKGEKLSLFDAGPRTEEAFDALKSGIESFGYKTEDIEQVILTHHHPDHSGWADGFPNAVLYGHEYNNLWLTRDSKFIEFHDQFYMDRFQEQGVPEKALRIVKNMKKAADLMAARPLDHFLKDGDEVPGHPGWRVLETLGHAQSHLSFWNPDTQELIGGDLLLAKVSSNPLVEPPLNPKSERPKTLLQYNESLKRLLELPIKTVYSGHGEPVTDIHALIETRLNKQHERALKVYAMLEAGSQSVYELTIQLFPFAYKKELGLTLSETLGQIDYLIDLGKVVQSIDKQGIYRYEQA